MNFLFHMHQPLYLKKEKVFLPFAFLHAIKDYYDMPLLAQKCNVKITFNLTPTLIELIGIYEEDFERDLFLSLLLRHPLDLSSDERAYLCKIFFSVNYDYFVKRYERFRELFKKQELSTQEFLDLEVIFLLSWCGNSLRSTHFIQNLLQKERGYRQEEKESLLLFLVDFIPSILPLYKKLLDRGQIAISTTPYAHPILPLLIDFEVAKCPIPNNAFSLRKDAQEQIRKAKEIYQKIFDKEPKGFWPAEGAVSGEAVEMLYKEGVEWIATDEIILKKSSSKCQENICEYNGVKIFFRNHYLSDLIGFSYRYMSSDEALEDLFSKAKEDDLIILDGENAWEYYKNGGYDFLEKLFCALKNTQTFDELAQKEVPKLQKIAAGSWIDGDFHTWTCQKEKNRAWEEFFKMRRLVEADKRIFLLEGSDWYWWYGDTNYSEFKKEFDEIFRENIKELYIEHGLPYPSYLDSPLETIEEEQLFSFPRYYITPTIDGEVTFFEWIGAGEVIFKKGVMDTHRVVEWVKFGEDEEYFYLLTHKGVSVEILNSEFEMKEQEYIEVKAKKKEEIGVKFSKGEYFQVLYLYTSEEEYLKHWYI